MNTIKSLTILLLSFIQANSLHRQANSLHRQAEIIGTIGVAAIESAFQNESMFDTQWSGDSCDKLCQSADGMVCGMHWKQCCSKDCQGFLVKNCLNQNRIRSKDFGCSQGGQQKPQQKPKHICPTGAVWNDVSNQCLNCPLPNFTLQKNPDTGKWQCYCNSPYKMVSKADGKKACES